MVVRSNNKFITHWCELFGCVSSTPTVSKDQIATCQSEEIYANAGTFSFFLLLLLFLNKHFVSGYSDTVTIFGRQEFPDLFITNKNSYLTFTSSIYLSVLENNRQHTKTLQTSLIFNILAKIILRYVVRIIRN